MPWFTRWFFGLSILLLTLSVFSFEAQGQDRTTVDQKIIFKRGASSAMIKRQIRKGISHQYRVQARAGQNMTVILKTGSQTSFTIFNLRLGTLEGADGETIWRGVLPETGEYFILIGTDTKAGYTLEIHIK